MSGVNDRREKDTARAVEMLKIAAKIIREHMPEVEVFYDNTICDGSCVADDCESAAEGLEEG